MSSTNYSLTLPADTQLVMEREFDASPALVFRAYTEPELIPQWWGWRTAKTVIDKHDLTPGGEWRRVSVMPDGTEYAFRGHYTTIEPAVKLVYTFEWEGMPGHICEDSAVFTDLGGRTRLTVTTTFASQEDRDGLISTGMEEGAIETWTRLEELLATLS